MNTVLSIAGSDCSGGAGIQADIKTITALNTYAMSAITALTAQNTTGVYGVLDVEPYFLEKQLDCIFTDIFPDAVKIGMVSNVDNIKVIASKLKEYKAKNIVIDPVMVSTSRDSLLEEDAKNYLLNTLLVCADVVTPNIIEAEVLSQITINNRDDMISAAKIISEKINGAVLIKGGHFEKENYSDDLLYENTCAYWFKGKRITNTNTHGTGCTLSSAIACGLAKGYSIHKSVGEAKCYISGAINAGLNLGRGRGPLNHAWNFG